MLYDGLTGWHLLILAGVVMLLFGARRLPDAARALGQTVRILRAEARELTHDAPASAAPPDTTGPGPDAGGDRAP
ncbi:twin-arginine translocase TatA/TatE family subunit [Actinomycetospora endophytica]|uniref:Sec-independent protein translocase protein TatA n=1 Tax=Actinomycetospora endophytica TaxID=2291215 RepID=A0ABS8P1B7_9PSEU|nr:twin-arginine translocase TatA/TatE family subunit [Actinomycetospora endophytica]MCD2191884.1 twin-arginine translocase TatA/TatE family subunit [Actinomycetospora endophytica]